MKLLTAFLALVLCSTLFCSAAWAQVSSSRTYFGSNGPQGGERPGSYSGPGSAPDHFVVHIYGDGSGATIQVDSEGGGDICGRTIYFTGTMVFDPNTTTGTIDGLMSRCTNPLLVVPPCNEKPIYEVRCTGTFVRSAGNYVINITWPAQIWVKEECQNKREEDGKEEITLTYLPAPPATPDPGWSDWLRERVDQGDQYVRDLVSGRVFRPR